MNPNLVRTALKITVGIAGSLAIGTLIKGEHRLVKVIEAHWPKEGTTTQS